MNSVQLIGRLTQDPELRFSQGSNMAVARFTLAVDKGLSRDKRDEMAKQGKPTADFPRIIVFGRQAENCANYLAKGKMCAVSGSVQTGSYKNQQGQKVYTTEILANRVEFLEKIDRQEPQQKPKQTKDDFDTFSQVNDDDFGDSIPF